MISRLAQQKRRARVGVFAGGVLALTLALAACGDSEPRKSGEFKLNPGDFYCTGYKETSAGDAMLLPGDFYWRGSTNLDCPAS